MIAEHIQTLLQDAKITAVIGELPGSQTNVIAINEYNNGINTEYFGARDSSTIYNPVVKVVIRNSSYQAAQDLAERVNAALHRVHDAVILSMLGVGAPIYLGRDTNRNHVFQATFTVQTKE